MGIDMRIRLLSDEELAQEWGEQVQDHERRYLDELYATYERLNIEIRHMERRVGSSSARGTKDSRRYSLGFVGTWRGRKPELSRQSFRRRLQ
jgi:hypothetical protein